jgi:hypothetical protein
VQAAWLCQATGYGAHAVTDALSLLEEMGLAIHESHRSGWRLACPNPAAEPPPDKMTAGEATRQQIAKCDPQAGQNAIRDHKHRTSSADHPPEGLGPVEGPADKIAKGDPQPRRTAIRDRGGLVKLNTVQVVKLIHWKLSFLEFLIVRLHLKIAKWGTVVSP